MKGILALHVPQHLSTLPFEPVYLFNFAYFTYYR